MSYVYSVGVNNDNNNSKQVALFYGVRGCKWRCEMIPVQYPEDSYYDDSYYDVRYGHSEEYGCDIIEVVDPALERKDVKE